MALKVGGLPVRIRSAATTHFAPDYEWQSPGPHGCWLPPTQVSWLPPRLASAHTEQMRANGRAIEIACVTITDAEWQPLCGCVMREL
jgi:hypothetical protein